MVTIESLFVDFDKENVGIEDVIKPRNTKDVSAKFVFVAYTETSGINPHKCRAIL